MSSDIVIGTLNRLLAIHCQSISNYLTQTSPWSAGPSDRSREALDHLVKDQQWLIDRIARYIDQLGGNPDPGHRRDLTSLNDLSLDFLIQRVIESQHDDIHAIENCVESLEQDVEARGLAQQALGIAKGHLETLEEIVREVELLDDGDVPTEK